MLTIADSKLNLSKIQEAVLKVSSVDKEKHLKQYINTVIEIDKMAYDVLINEINSVGHNQTLEEEFKFLETIVNDYNKYIELQTHYKKVCLEYGNVQLDLTDVSLIDFSYINKRYNAIKGYLYNIRSLDEGKEEIQKLNSSLIDEEKKKSSLDNRMHDMDNTLKNNFVAAEGRYIIDGKLSYISVVSEYRQIGLDFLKLLDDEKDLRHLLYDAEKDLTDVSEKLRTAEVCCNSLVSFNSKQILDDINSEYLKVKYKYSMLKIASLLVSNSESYNMFKKKREDILDLIKDRANCLQGLGYNVSIDPFERTRVKEQLDSIMMLPDNTELINKLRKNISSLTNRMDEMLSQNNEYLITIGEIKPLVISNMSFNDIDVSPVLSFDELVGKRETKENQVIGVKHVSSKIDINIVKKKTASVIGRVNEMLNKKEVKAPEFIVPELVLGPKEAVLVETKKDIAEVKDVVEEAAASKEEEKPINNVLDTNNIDLDIFSNVNPFEEPVLFANKAERDDKEVILDIGKDIDLSTMELNEDNKNVVTEPMDLSDAMPDAFWVTGPTIEDKEEVNQSLSFDDQINALLSSENKEVKVKKRVA